MARRNGVCLSARMDSIPHFPTLVREVYFLITAHDTSLFDTELLRRDQICFVESGENQASRLYPLSDFSACKDEALEHGYLRGHHGAVPALTLVSVR